MMQEYSFIARAYILATILTGAGLLFSSSSLLTLEDPWLFVLLAALSAFAGAQKVTLPGNCSMSVGAAFVMATLFLLGPHAMVVVGCISGLSSSLVNTHKRSELDQMLFNAASVVVASAVAAQVFLLANGRVGLEPLAESLAPILAMVSIFYLLNTFSVSLVIALTTSQRVQEIASIWRENFLWTGPGYLASASIAMLLALLMERMGFIAFLISLPPLFVIYYSYQLYVDRLKEHADHLQEMERLHLSTIEALATAIDARDEITHDHIRRVQTYAEELAKDLGVGEDLIRGLRAAALLHDIGKLAVPDFILNKPGKLTPAEFEKMKIHTVIGAAILETVPFPYPVVPIVLDHHEKWNGEGYPNGKRGEEIHLGARILAVADFYDALRSDRPYRQKCSREYTINLLKEEAEKSFDPQVVEMFRANLDRYTQIVQSLPPIGSGIEKSFAEAKEAERAARSSRKAEEDEAPSMGSSINTAATDIVSLLDVTNTIGTSLNLTDSLHVIGSRLAQLIPFSSCVVYLFDEQDGNLHPTVVFGEYQTVLGKNIIALGEGTSGWAAVNRQIVRNENLRSDFSHLPNAEKVSDLSATLIAPLSYDGELLGTLSFYDRLENRYTREHMELVEVVAQQVSTVIHNAIEEEEEGGEPILDPLTALPNARYLSVRLDEEIERARRRGKRFVVLAVELNGFREVNEEHSRPIGDAVLKAYADLFRRSVRKCDICCRNAGGDFVVIMPETSLSKARAPVQRLRQEAQNFSFRVSEEEEIVLTANIGLAEYPRNGRDPQSLLSAAEGALSGKTQRRGEEGTEKSSKALARNSLQR